MDFRQLTAAQVTMVAVRLWLCLLPLLACSALEEAASNFSPYTGKISFQILYFNETWIAFRRNVMIDTSILICRILKSCVLNGVLSDPLSLLVKISYFVKLLSCSFGDCFLWKLTIILQEITFQ
jgi:hypothetical protein